MNSSIALLVVAVFVGGPLVLASPAGADSRAVIEDRVADTVDEDDGTPVDVPEADVIVSEISWTAKGVALALRVRKPTAPLSDPGWTGATEIEWDLDTGEDGNPDFVVDYYVEQGAIRGGVYRFSANEDEPAICELRPTYFGGDKGYVVEVDPACLGHPRTIAYAATFSYDTDPAAEDSVVAEDEAPDSGLTPHPGVTAPAASAGPQW